SPQKTLEFACATGSYVATQHGATPSFSEETIVSTILSTTTI
ncbi:MAG: carbohydrate kinase, partial [Cytophagaceae bacterium]